MNRIYHYVNLVCWYDVYKLLREENFNVDKHIVFCDTVSLRFMSFLFKNKKIVKTGPVEFFKRMHIKDVFYLSAKNISDNHIILPIFDSKEDMKVFAKEFKTNCKNIFIGISSPKQNILANEISKNLNDKNIYCFGGAIYLNKNNANLSKLWIRFVKEYPIRTLYKIILTIRNAIIICVNKKHRKNFKHFLELIQL